jgi:hypothetical protein
MKGRRILVALALSLPVLAPAVFFLTLGGWTLYQAGPREGPTGLSDLPRTLVFDTLWSVPALVLAAISLLVVLLALIHAGRTALRLPTELRWAAREGEEAVRRAETRLRRPARLAALVGVAVLAAHLVFAAWKFLGPARGFADGFGTPTLAALRTGIAIASIGLLGAGVCALVVDYRLAVRRPT